MCNISLDVFTWSRPCELRLLPCCCLGQQATCGLPVKVFLNEFEPVGREFFVQRLVLVDICQLAGELPSGPGDKPLQSLRQLDALRRNVRHHTRDSMSEALEHFTLEPGAVTQRRRGTSQPVQQPCKVRHIAQYADVVRLQ